MSKPKRSQDLVKEITDLGSILVRMCAVDQDAIDAAVVVQQNTDPKQKLGEILLDMGAVSSERLADALELQRRLRAAGNNVEAMADLLETARSSVLARMKRIAG